MRGFWHAPADDVDKCELDLRAAGWISADTWEQWRTGMAALLSRWPFKAVTWSARVRLSVVDGRLLQVIITSGRRSENGRS